MSNRSESNKPLPRKQRVVNRGYLYSRKDENVKNLDLIIIKSFFISYELNKNCKDLK